MRDVNMPQENLVDFFTYFKSTPNQLEAVALLQKSMPDNLLTSEAGWVVKWREPEPEPPAPEWPLTKEQMGKIMGCSANSLPDSLMDDYARCVETFGMDKLAQVYFLGQCGHESCGLRYPVEIHDGSNYEGRTDLGNTIPGQGVMYAGTGWIQVTGYANHKSFSDYMTSIGKPDPKILEIGKTYSSEKYPWTISGNWWRCNNMNAMCAARPQCTNSQIDEIGCRVNGRMRPNGADDRIAYTDRAYKVLMKNE